MNQIKAIFFDVGGTLVYTPISIEQFLQNSYRKLGFRYSIEQISVAREKVEKWWKENF